MNNILTIQEVLETIPLIKSLFELVKIKYEDYSLINMDITEDSEFNEYKSNKNSLYNVTLWYYPVVKDIEFIISFEGVSIFRLDINTKQDIIDIEGKNVITFSRTKPISEYYTYIHTNDISSNNNQEYYNFKYIEYNDFKRAAIYESVPKKDEEYFMKSLVHELPEREDLEKYFSEMKALCESTNKNVIQVKGYNELLRENKSIHNIKNICTEMNELILAYTDAFIKNKVKQ